MVYYRIESELRNYLRFKIVNRIRKDAHKACAILQNVFGI